MEPYLHIRYSVNICFSRNKCRTKKTGIFYDLKVDKRCSSTKCYSSTNHECHSQNSMRNNNLPAFRNPALEYNGEIQDRNHKIHQKRSRERSKIRYYFHNTGKCKTIGRNNKRKHTEMRERDRTKTIET